MIMNNVLKMNHLGNKYVFGTLTVKHYIKQVYLFDQFFVPVYWCERLCHKYGR